MTINKTCTPHSGLSSILLAAAWLFGGLTEPLSASECDTPVAQSVSVQGQVEVSAEGNPSWSPLKQQQWLCPGDRIRVGANSRAGLVLNDDTLLRLAENSSVRISAPSKEGNAWLDLLDGVAHFLSRVRHPFQVNTPYVNASIEGTEFTVKTSADGSSVTVLEGQVLATNAEGEVRLNGGERALALPGKTPQVETVVDPLNAVQWCLYYPPVTLPVNATPSSDLQQSYAANRQGDIERAFNALSLVANVAQEPDLLVYRASLHLQVGGLDAAQRDLAAAIKLQPEHADALALMSIISSVRNEPQQALELAQRAVQTGAESAAPLLALSYARQASFQLPEALDAAEQATRVEPDNALAWARLADMHLMFRQLDAAAEAASRAEAIAPDLAQTQTTLGFAELTRLKLDAARQAFTKAASLDQASPLPRLGLGLVLIREGELAQGRRQIETAANLEPGNALIRSYLGKAYYEEKRDKRASTQFQLAKEFDELDPTAWFYDALLKQSTNRPVEALNDLQTSIELNDNRAVYRSRLLLDQDEAARNTSQARIYQDLGFDRLALSEGYKSLQVSPATHSAHRMLSDSYTGKPRYESARVSELLQSQLLQPLNTTPIQPQLSASNLGILNGAGPSSGGYSEYTPLFTRNGVDIQFNAIGGANRTGGDDLVISGLHDRISYSLGQFHYETDGWRENNDLKQDIYNAFLQASLSANTSIQFEYRSQESESGDLAFKFDPMDFSEVARFETKSSLGRIGIHHQPAPGTDLLASFIYQDLEQVESENYTRFFPSIDTNSPYGFLPGVVDVARATTRDSIAQTSELQWIQHIRDHVFTLGASYHDEDRSDRYDSLQTLRIELPGPPFLYVNSQDDSIPPVEIDPSYKNVYLYSLLQLPHEFNLTLGAAYADFESSVFEADSVDPKVGMTWEAWENVVLRATYLENLARPSNMDRSIEPTQVAGFNQLYDEVQGSEIKHYGFGIDIKPSRSLSIGMEFNRRKLKVPFFVVGVDSAALEDRDEKRYLAYLYWTPLRNLGINLSYENEQFKRDFSSPESLDTQRLPIGVSYFWQSGFYLKTIGTYIDQEIKQSGNTDQENFWNLDTVVGYRFPKHFGKAEIIVKNMLDKEFRYYDLSFQTGDPLPPQYQPERQIFARVTINF
jgi:tetratricopeptide (TPR) repeat protein